MKAMHTLSSLDNEAAGPSYTVPRLASALAAHGVISQISTLGPEGASKAHGADVMSYARDPASMPAIAKLGRSRSMREALLTSQADIFHTHGLWMMPNVYPAFAARRAGKPFVLAPRGMLGRDARKYSAHAKLLFWALWQKRALDCVSCFHATAESEYDDIRAFGLKQPVAIVPNGIDLPVLSQLYTNDACPSRPADAPFILSLGRIHPKKGLDRLVAAFALVAVEHPQWSLRIVGPDQGGYSAQLKNQIQQTGLAGRVSIEASVFGERKFALMRQAHVFALSTLHENFGMTVAESLAVETPVISTRGAPWSGLIENRCGWWIDHGPDMLAAAMTEAMALSRDERAKMGARGRDWMRRDFSWDAIGQKMESVYRWCAGQGDRPECVVE